MRNDGPIWNGQTGGPNDYQRAVGKDTPPDAQDWQAVTAEMIATQRGLTAAGKAVKALQARVNELSDNAPNAQDWQAVTAEMVAAQRGLVAASEAASEAAREAVKALCSKVQELLDKESETRQAIASGQQAGNEAFKIISDQFAEWNALLVGFDSVEEARFWIEQAANQRTSVVERTGFPAKKFRFLSENTAG